MTLRKSVAAVLVLDELLDRFEALGRQGAAGPVGRDLFDAGDVLEQPAGDAVDGGGPLVVFGAVGQTVDEPGVVGEFFGVGHQWFP
ncbi:MAG: hypothetical protein OXG04_18620 [Acidobacteria bacterium]|nr:hypothetical protein [Acidobacteriota bacterium]